MMHSSQLTADEKKILKLIFGYGSDTIKGYSELTTEFSAQKITAVAKKFSGINFKIGRIEYVPPLRHSFSKAAPGIANPRIGYGSYEPAEVHVHKNVRK